MNTSEILAEVTGGSNAFKLGDMVEGRGEMVGVVAQLRPDGDVEVRWEDGELWTYPPNFLTLSFRQIPEPTQPPTRTILLPDGCPWDPDTGPADPDWVRRDIQPSDVPPRLTTDRDRRKEVPLASGCFDYFPDALAAVAELSYRGNQKHNPGEPLHWARGKSTDEADCLLRHLLERGTTDTDGIRHSVKVAWRALALLQKELEAANALPISRGSRP